MRIRMASLLVLVAGLAVVAAPMSPALADRGRGSDDTHQDDRGGRRNGSDDRRDDDRGRGRGSDDSSSSSSNSSSSSAASNSGGNSREQRFIARMRDTDGTTARARYREKARGDRVQKQSFDIEIKRAQPGEQFLVRVDGRVIGTVTANNLGFGKLELRRSPSGPNEVPIGSDFPRLRTGAVVTVGSMQGTLSLQ